MGPAGSRRIPRAPRYSGAVLRGASRFAYGTVTLCGAGFHRASATLGSCARRRSYNPGRGHKTAPVWAPARSLATTCAIIVIFSSSGYLDVSVPRVRPPRQPWCGGIAPAGFPHSDIRGSQGICPSPRLFAACHVLRRLREPQASPMRPFCLSYVSLAFLTLHSSFARLLCNSTIIASISRPFPLIRTADNAHAR